MNTTSLPRRMLPVVIITVATLMLAGCHVAHRAAHRGHGNGGHGGHGGHGHQQSEALPQADTQAPLT